MKHWNPHEDLADRACPQHALDRELADRALASRIAAEELARASKRSWPEGATAGLVLVAVSCIALGAVLYQFAGPRDVVEESIGRR